MAVFIIQTLLYMTSMLQSCIAGCCYKNMCLSIFFSEVCQNLKIYMTIIVPKKYNKGLVALLFTAAGHLIVMDIAA